MVKTSILSKAPVMLDYATPPKDGRGSIWDDVAYIGPMAVFLALTWAGGHWNSFYAKSYILKTILAAALMIVMRRRYTRIVWRFWWLGALVGVIVVFQWVGMENFILKHWPHYPRMAPGPIHNPFELFGPGWQRWTFVAIRWADAALVVPFMEELFWRDYLWRNVLSPNDFKLAGVGEWDWKAYVIVAVAFGAGVHFEWMTAITCGLIYGALLVFTRSLGACIVAHGVTNFLLGAYVLAYGQWQFW